MSIECFWTQATDSVRRSLRRFCFSDEKCKCPLPAGYHNALAPVDVIDHPASDPMNAPTGDAKFPPTDPRWPSHCACGYKFSENDPRQIYPERLYERVDVVPPQRMTLDEAPAGAMHDAEHMRTPSRSFVGPDGISLTVKLPDGSWWLIDGPSSQGGRWTRSGLIPNITVTPSIQTPKYHGWLKAGRLESV